MKVTVRTVLPHPPERVFDYVADMRNDPEWAPFVTDVALVKGNGPGVGTRWQFKQAVGEHTIDMEAEMTVHERPTELGWVFDHRSLDYESTVTLAPHPKGTKWVQTNIEVWHRAPFMLRLMMPILVRRQLRKQLVLLERALAKSG